MPQFYPDPPDAEACMSVSSDAILDHLEKFLERLAYSSRQAYFKDLESFSGWLGQVSVLAGMTTLLAGGCTRASDILARFVADHQHGLLVSPRVRRRLSAVRSWLAYAVAVGLITWRTNAPSLLTLRPHHAPDLNDEDLHSILLAVAENDAVRHARDVAILVLLFALGLRTGEIAALDLADVHERDQTIEVRHVRRKSRDVLSVPSTAWQVLARWLVQRTHHPGPLFMRLRPGGYPVWDGRLSTRGLRRIAAAWSERAGVTANPRRIRRAAIVAAADRPHATRCVLTFARLDALPATTVGGPAASGQSVATDLMHSLQGAQTGVDDHVLP